MPQAAQRAPGKERDMVWHLTNALILGFLLGVSMRLVSRVLS
jgi:hypothetical protein